MLLISSWTPLRFSVLRLKLSLAILWHWLTALWVWKLVISYKKNSNYLPSARRRHKWQSRRVESSRGTRNARDATTSPFDPCPTREQSSSSTTTDPTRPLCAPEFVDQLPEIFVINLGMKTSDDGQKYIASIKSFINRQTLTGKTPLYLFRNRVSAKYAENNTKSTVGSTQISHRKSKVANVGLASVVCNL